MKRLLMRKWLIAFLALVFIGASAPAAITQTTHAGTQVPRLIVNVNSYKILGVSGWDKQADGANIIQWFYDPASIANDQKWYFENLGTGYYHIRNAESGDLLEVSGASTSNGANVIQWPDNEGLNQQWQVITAGEDRGHSSYIINRGSGKYLDMSGWSTSAGGQAIQWDYIGGANQRWFIY
ncbi:RICIN domain-containing protein [Paenibacillus alba]|uniref:RICIN domain-containing protein n=1 Tax=Paenibacillus alba TaxID=1197127 RepID=A0ABU6G4B0_9BACL|nr:RICIN domain-containing protein [Paenibacillus alba]MEC0227604.1 RICIN domain-containing protein [Paenibacillus alba]